MLDLDLTDLDALPGYIEFDGTATEIFIRTYGIDGIVAKRDIRQISSSSFRSSTSVLNSTQGGPAFLISQVFSFSHYVLIQKRARNGDRCQQQMLM